MNPRARLATVLAVAGLLTPAAQVHASTNDAGTGGVWADAPVGFAAVPGADGTGPTTGGAGGPAVDVTTLDQLRAHATAAGPRIVRIVRSITVVPFGDMVPVGSDKTIVGVGAGAELVGGGLFLDGSRNVVIRNLTIRDSYVPGDWDGKRPDNDNDGIRMDTASHVWIDHTRIERVGDGGIDIRRDSDHVTLSWNVISDINKALGVGWTDNVVTRLTAHHNWVRNTVQRNWSIDNAAAAHLYNNVLSDVAMYGTMSRKGARVLVEDSVFEHVEDPLVVLDPTAQLVQRRNLFTATSGRHDSAGTAFDPGAWYTVTPEPATAAARAVKAHAGPVRRAEHTPRVITVALDGTGTYASLQAALGATRDARGPVTIVVRPGEYRELVRIWPSQSGVTLTGATDDPRAVVVTYDLAADGRKFYGGAFGAAGSATLAVLGSGITVRGLTVANGAVSGPAPTVRSVGDRAVFDGTRFAGAYVADAATRSYLRACEVDGSADLVSGPGTAVFDGCAVVSRGAGGAVAAAGTAARQRFGFLFTRCVFTGDGTVHLGRPVSGAAAQVVVRESVLGAHIADPPWLDPDGHARFAEYANTGPGATGTADRPRLTPAQAARYTRETYLRGWRPWR